MCWLCAIPAICKFAGMTAAAVMSTVCTGANLGKGWTVYLEGRDLADTPHIVRVESADGSQVNHERSYMNRRLVVLGCKWTF